jgi:6-phosphogluconolactonase
MIEIYEDLESLSKAAAALFVQRSQQAVRARDRFSVALAGGHTPERTYQLLAQPPLCNQVPWAKVHVFWGDERCVPPDDPQNNARMARQALLDHVPIRESQVHPIRCAGDAHRAAEAYEGLLRTFFGNGSPVFDLVYLGLGENGHTASIFPGTPVVEERSRWAAEIYVAEQDMWRVTLTAPLINQAAAVAFLVAGATKARILQRVLEGRFEPHRVPAQLIRPADGTLLWMADREANQELGKANKERDPASDQEVSNEQPKV